MEKINELVDEAIKLEAILIEKEHLYEIASKVYFDAPLHDKRTKVYKEYDRASKEARIARQAYSDVVYRIGLRAIHNTKAFRAQAAKYHK